MITWLEEMVNAGGAERKSFEAGLGRLGFVCGAVVFDRPFLAPLHTWAATRGGAAIASSRSSCGSSSHSWPGASGRGARSIAREEDREEGRLLNGSEAMPRRKGTASLSGAGR